MGHEEHVGHNEGLLTANTTIIVQHDKKPEHISKFQAYKNLLVVSLGFLFLFTAFQALSNLQVVNLFNCLLIYFHGLLLQEKDNLKFPATKWFP